MAESANVTEIYLALPRNAMAAAAPAVQTAWNEQRNASEIGFQAMPELAD
jgi:hypothetical protein